MSGLVGIGCISGSCAKFPANSGANFTAITVTFTVAGQINPNYVYDVAFTPYDTPNPTITGAPLIVLNGSNNPNGRVTGSPCEFVEYPSPAGVNSATPFALYQFATSGQSGGSSDGNPINLAVYSPSQLGVITNFTTPQTGGLQNQLSFTIYTNELTAADGATGKNLQSMQINILTMTRPSNLGSGTRIIDGLGDDRTANGLNGFLQVNLLQSAPYTNSAGYEPTGDTLGGTDPDIDIIDYTVTVSHP
jgi:hypothetical protein